MIIKSKNIIALFVTIIVALSSFAITSTIMPSYIYPQTLEEELQQLQQEREQTRKKIEEVTKTESQYRREVDQVEGELLTALSELEELNKKLAEAKAEVDKTTIEMVLKEEELKRIEDELEESIKKLNGRVVAIYKNGNGNILEFILNAEDFIDFISKLKLMNLFAEQDTENIISIKEKREATIGIKKSIIDLRERQKEYKSEVEKLVAQAEQKTSEVEDLYGEKKNLLSTTTANKNALISMEKELAKKEAEVKRILESYKDGSAPSGK
ncbi:MAG: hypothetical protein PHN81_04965, partial [Actinomycetota bacterium]|nr:hypothetical protein [Actinomycetota bacterium]